MTRAIQMEISIYHCKYELPGHEHEARHIYLSSKNVKNETAPNFCTRTQRSGSGIILKKDKTYDTTARV